MTDTPTTPNPGGFVARFDQASIEERLRIIDGRIQRLVMGGAALPERLAPRVGPDDAARIGVLTQQDLPWLLAVVAQLLRDRADYQNRLGQAQAKLDNQRGALADANRTIRDLQTAEGRRQARNGRPVGQRGR